MKLDNLESVQCILIMYYVSLKRETLSITLRESIIFVFLFLTEGQPRRY